MAASGQFLSDRFENYAAVGELGLDGSLRPIRGVLSMAPRRPGAGVEGDFSAGRDGAREAAVVTEIEAIPVGSLSEAVGFYTGELDIDPHPFRWEDAVAEDAGYKVDYADVKGQEFAKRAVVVAAAGSHHLLMIGPTWYW